MYTCQASNNEGIDREDIRLTVVGKSVIVTMEIFHLMHTVAPPMIVHSSEASPMVDPGDDVTLSCQTTGRPTPSLSWTLNDNEIIGDSRHVISGDQLEIKQFRNSDQGSYSCIANNRLGVDKKTFTVFMKSELICIVLLFVNSIKCHKSHQSNFRVNFCDLICKKCWGRRNY